MNAPTKDDPRKYLDPRTLAKVRVRLDGACIDGVFEPFLPTREVAVRLSRETTEPLGESQLVATDEGVYPIAGEVVEAVFGIEQAEDQGVASGQDQRLIIGVDTGVVELRFVRTLLHEEGDKVLKYLRKRTL